VLAARRSTGRGWSRFSNELASRWWPSTCPEYADLAVAAAQQFSDVVIVAQSLGGFTAPMAAERLPVSEIVLVNAMIPAPGETPGQWWEATGAIEEREAAARRGGYGDFDVATYFLHDVDTTGLGANPPDEADAVFGTPCEFESWPWRTRVLAGADDRFFPPTFQTRVARERIGTDASVRSGGHLIALAQPHVVADFLLHRAD
jgi:pimeloyl-ACP methyl ester carboxylesterase